MTWSTAAPKTATAAKYLIPAGALCAAGAYFLRRTPNAKRSLAGRVALITGGSRGLGLELARKLALERCRLILVARDSGELSRAAGQLKEAGAEVATVACDLSKPEEITRMVKEAASVFGKVDILINNAGEITVGPIDAFDESEFQRALDLIFWAGVRTTLALLPQFLRSADADIVNITSVGGKIAVPHLLPYVAAKFAMTGFSEGIQSELRGRGVHVLTAIPGLMRTGSHVNASFAGNHAREYRWFALGATLPGASMQVSRAAGQIVDALIDRKREIVLSAAAQIAASVYGAFPEISLQLAEFVNDKILPAPSTDKTRKKGSELESGQPALFKALTGFGRKAAKSQNQL